MLDLEINVLKVYQLLKRKMISKYFLGVIYDQNTQSNLIIINNKADIFELSFLFYGATITRTPLLNISVSGKISRFLYYNLLIVSVT